VSKALAAASSRLLWCCFGAAAQHSVRCRLADWWVLLRRWAHLRRACVSTDCVL